MALNYERATTQKRSPSRVTRKIVRFLASLTVLGVIVLATYVGIRRLVFYSAVRAGLQAKPRGVVFDDSGDKTVSIPAGASTALVDTYSPTQVGYIPPEWKTLRSRLGFDEMTGPLLLIQEFKSDGKYLNAVTFEGRQGLALYFDCLSYRLSGTVADYHFSRFVCSIPIDRQDLWDQPLQISAGVAKPGDPLKIVLPCKVGMQDGELVIKLLADGHSFDSVHLEMRHSGSRSN